MANDTAADDTVAETSYTVTTLQHDHSRAASKPHRLCSQAEEQPNKLFLRQFSTHRLGRLGPTSKHRSGHVRDLADTSVVSSVRSTLICSNGQAPNQGVRLFWWQTHQPTGEAQNSLPPRTQTALRAAPER
eukprot:1344114-Amphidinium_carterae.1